MIGIIIFLAYAATGMGFAYSARASGANRPDAIMFSVFWPVFLFSGFGMWLEQVTTRHFDRVARGRATTSSGAN